MAAAFVASVKSASISAAVDEPPEALSEPKLSIPRSCAAILPIVVVI